MRTAHPREQLGNRLICDSLAISYSRDIDDTIAEEDEVEEEDNSSRGSSSRGRANINQEARRRTGNVDGDDDEDDDAMSNGHAALLEQVVIGGGSGRSRSGGVRRGRGHSRSVSPGSRAPQQQHHDYVNSAPGSRFLEDTIPAIPPPPQSSAKFQKQQFFSVQPGGAGADSDPYGKEFDAIGSRVPATAVNPAPSSTGSRINGRVLPPEVRKEQQLAIPPRLRNGFVPGSSSGSGGSGGV